MQRTQIIVIINRIKTRENQYVEQYIFKILYFIFGDGVNLEEKCVSRVDFLADFRILYINSY